MIGSRWARDPAVIICVVYIVGLLAWSLSGVFPHDPTFADSANTYVAPNTTYWFGTDQNGYDVFSRAVYAAKFDVLMALVGAGVAAVIGSAIGVIVSRPSFFSAGANRVLDMFQAVPLLVVAITVVGLVGASRNIIVALIIIINIPLFIRLVQGEGRLVRMRGYVTAARAYGVPERVIRWRHILPNVTGVIFPQVSLSVGYAVMTISALSFLGLAEPGAASWGSMIQVGVALLPLGQWWITFFPSLVLFTFVLAFSELSHVLQRHIERPRGGGE